MNGQGGYDHHPNPHQDNFTPAGGGRPPPPPLPDNQVPFVQPPRRTREYNWKLAGTTECSASCGKGQWHNLSILYSFFLLTVREDQSSVPPHSLKTHSSTGLRVQIKKLFLLSLKDSDTLSFTVCPGWHKPRCRTLCATAAVNHRHRKRPATCSPALHCEKHHSSVYLQMHIRIFYHKTVQQFGQVIQDSEKL